MRSTEALAIVKTIVQLGCNMKLEVTAEGVEDDEQLTMLQMLGCTEVQGYLISEPIEPAMFKRFVKSQHGSSLFRHLLG